MNSRRGDIHKLSCNGICSKEEGKTMHNDPDKSDTTGRNSGVRQVEKGKRAVLNKETLFRVLEEMPIGVYIADQKGKIIYGNRAGQQIWAGLKYVSPDKFSEYKAWWADSGKPISSDDWALYRAITKGEISTGEEIDIECFDGTRKTIRNSAVPLYDKEGKVYGGFATNVDITSQKAASAELKRLANFPSENPNPVLQMSHDGHILYANVASTGLLKDLDHTDGSPLNETWTEIVTKVLKLQKPETIEMAIGDRFFSFSFAPIAEDRVNVYVLDITERKRTEGTLARTQRLESLGHLAAGIAHDFNNLLGGIYGNIDLALVAKLPQKAERALARAAATIDRARSITQQLITFSKGGTSTLKLCDIVDAVRSATRYQLSLSGSDISADFTIPTGIWQCMGDRVQIEQVIRDLIQNAIEAMPGNGKIVIGIANTTIGDENGINLTLGNYVRISVRDQGVGIPTEIRHQIFDPFFTTKELGRGLGLSTSFSIIGRHNGAIEVESNPQQGVTFHVYIPSIHEAAPVKEDDKATHGKQRLLLMDDDEVILTPTSQLLTISGFDVITAINGQEALDSFITAMNSGTPFDIVILDLTIRTGWGGIRTVEEIRKVDPEVPVIVASGYSSDPAMAHPSQFGFTDSIRKPFKMNELLAKLEKITPVERQ